jgi:hypothetical protein
VVWRWRKALGVTKTNNARTYQLLTEAGQAGADAIKAIPSTIAHKDDPGHWWRAEDLALLGTMPDAEVARRTGRTLDAVQNARTRRGIANCWEWTEEEIALLGTAPDAEIAARIGRTASAVLQKRFALGFPMANRQKGKHHHRQR